jgi:hypothetical protein
MKERDTNPLSSLDNPCSAKGLCVDNEVGSHQLPTDSCSMPPDLAAVVDAWPRLPEAIRAGIMAMVKAARP